MTLGFGLLSAQLRPGETDWTRAYDDTVRLAVEAELLARGTTHAGTPEELVEVLLGIRRQVPVPVEFVARSHLPMLEYDAQVEVMQQLAEGVAPHC
jgi:hypothetical protein